MSFITIKNLKNLKHKKLYILIATVIFSLIVIIIGFVLLFVKINDKNSNKKVDTQEIEKKTDVQEIEENNDVQEVEEKSEEGEVEEVKKEDEFVFSELKDEETLSDKDMIFLYSGELYASDFNFSKISKITNTNNTIIDFIISPDKKFIAYTVIDPEENEKYKSIFFNEIELITHLYLYDTTTKTSKLILGPTNVQIDPESCPLDEDGYTFYRPECVVETATWDIRLVSFNEESNKFIYTRKGIWVYDTVANKHTKISEDDISADDKGLWKNDWVVIYEIPYEGILSFVYKFKDGKLIEEKALDRPYMHMYGRTVMAIIDDTSLLMHEVILSEDEILHIKLYNSKLKNSEEIFSINTYTYWPRFVSIGDRLVYILFDDGKIYEIKDNRSLSIDNIPKIDSFIYEIKANPDGRLLLYLGDKDKGTCFMAYDMDDQNNTEPICKTWMDDIADYDLLN